MSEPNWIGQSNPLDEQPEEKEPEEFIMGEYRTITELIETLNKNSRVTFSIDEHEDGQLYIKGPFEQK